MHKKLLIIILFKASFIPVFIQSLLSKAPINPDNNPTKDIINLNNIWHDVSEESKIDEDVVLYDSCGNFVTEFYNGDVTWNNIVLFHKATMWAYIKDLLPKGGKK